MYSLDRISEVPGQGARVDEIVAQHRSDLGKRFRRVSPGKQRLFAEYAIAVSCYEHKPKLYLSVIFDRKRPPDIEWHQRRWNVFIAAFEDRERAIQWIIKAYSLGFGVHFQNSFKGWGGGLFHPCNEMFDHEAFEEWRRAQKH